MAHAQWHTQLPQYGSPGFGSAVSNRLRGQAAPPGLLSVRSRLSGMKPESPSDVSRLVETEEERKAKKLKKDKLWGNWGETAQGIGKGMFEHFGGTVGLETGPREQPPMMNLGMGRQQYGGRRRRYA